MRVLLLLLSIYQGAESMSAQCTDSCLNGIRDVDQTTNPELFTAIGCLCSLDALDQDNGNFEPAENIIRQDLGKALFSTLFGSQLAISPTYSFPTPLADLQGNWIPYYKYAKVMSYLEYEDGISVFDRDFYNFDPTDSPKAFFLSTRSAII